MEPGCLENIVVVGAHFDSRKEIVLPSTVIRLHQPWTSNPFMRACNRMMSWPRRSPSMMKTPREHVLVNRKNAPASLTPEIDHAAAVAVSSQLRICKTELRCQAELKQE
jgi:hypothetical protein